MEWDSPRTLVVDHHSIISAFPLRVVVQVGKKVDGMSDPYVTAAWASVAQQTRVIRSTCAPQYDETLYFPTNLVRVNAAELEAKLVEKVIKGISLTLRSCHRRLRAKPPCKAKSFLDPRSRS